MKQNYSIIFSIDVIIIEKYFEFHYKSFDVELNKK